MSSDQAATTATEEDATAESGADQTDDVNADASVNPSDDAGACPVVETIEQIGSEWRLVVLHDLQDGEKRFNELKRSTDASSRTLSRVLDDLADLGLVERRVESDAPIATFYSLTEKGGALCPVFDEIGAWADEYVEACND